MDGKRGQVLCSSDPGLLDNMYYDEPFGRVNRKRHCNVRSPFEMPSPGRREPSASLVYGEDTAITLDVEELDAMPSLHALTNEWSDKILEGLRRVQSTRDLKEQLVHYLVQFYHATVAVKCESAPQPPDKPDGSKEHLLNRIGQLGQHNTVLSGVVRRQYETIRRLQGSEAMASNLMKEKVALSEELANLKQAVNAYVGSVAAGVTKCCGPFDHSFSRRPPDVY
ncbi:dynein heavy chain 5 axonemal, putative [Babesia caballi]|uniref:Dynein heavy chain 5 axonemal, putative n=1 Tax=Babesia caballi TaxID=5871 RepID=A0AAV4LNP4_BABCB|nr:dynein heavy chain 5 axonemal, putative [Babesia caballi]